MARRRRAGPHDGAGAVAGRGQWGGAEWCTRWTERGRRGGKRGGRFWSWGARVEVRVEKVLFFGGFFTALRRVSSHRISEWAASVWRRRHNGICIHSLRYLLTAPRTTALARPPRPTAVSAPAPLDVLYLEGTVQCKGTLGTLTVPKGTVPSLGPLILYQSCALQTQGCRSRYPTPYLTPPYRAQPRLLDLPRLSDCPPLVHNYSSAP